MNTFLFLLFLYVGVLIVYLFTPYPTIIKKYPQLDQFKNHFENNL